MFTGHSRAKLGKEVFTLHPSSNHSKGQRHPDYRSVRVNTLRADDDQVQEDTLYHPNQASSSLGLMSFLIQAQAYP